MQLTVFQLFALVTHGNWWLSGHALERFYPEHPAFTFTREVRFVDRVRAGATVYELPFAEDPMAWFERLRRLQCQGLRALKLSGDGALIPEKDWVAFTGGVGMWSLEALTPLGADVWQAAWTRAASEASEQRIWRVMYRRVARHRPAARMAPVAVAEVSAALEETLHAVTAFADQHGLSGFARTFADAAALLHAPQMPELYGLAPEGQLSLPAACLLAAAQAAWVFGGMGSWNDLGFEGAEQERYEALSEALFRLLNQALVTVVNATFPSR